MAAIPDYSSGATEHWGIITFRETNIFYSESQSSAANKQRVASVVAHELAHQWFGNLGMFSFSVIDCFVYCLETKSNRSLANTTIGNNKIVEGNGYIMDLN